MLRRMYYETINKNCAVGFPKPEVTEELIGRVLEEQSTKIDAVSGSTVTCKAYLKSIENALRED